MESLKQNHNGKSTRDGKYPAKNTTENLQQSQRQIYSKNREMANLQQNTYRDSSFFLHPSGGIMQISKMNRDLLREVGKTI